MSIHQTPAGWYSDLVEGATKLRYWNGSSWTNDVRPAAPSMGAPPASTPVSTYPSQVTPSPGSPQAQWGTGFTQPAPFASGSAFSSVENKSTMWIIIGIVCIFLLTWPIAIGQIVTAAGARDLYARGDVAGYERKIKTAQTLLIVNICVGLVMWVCVVFYFASGLAFLR